MAKSFGMISTMIWVPKLQQLHGYIAATSTPHTFKEKQLHKFHKDRLYQKKSNINKHLSLCMKFKEMPVFFQPFKPFKHRRSLKVVRLMQGRVGFLGFWARWNNFQNNKPTRNPETNSKFAPENGWLEYDSFLLKWPIFRCYVSLPESNQLREVFNCKQVA